MRGPVYGKRRQEGASRSPRRRCPASRDPHGHIRNEQGFTLLELLVAIMVFAVMAVMAYSGLNVVMNDRESLQKSLDRIAALQKAVYRLETDLADVRRRPIRGRYGDIKPAFLAAKGVVSFTRGGLSNPLHLPRSTLERIGYTVDDDKLIRLRWLTLDRAPDGKPIRTTLLKGVTKISWRFTGSGGQSFAQWPPPNETNRITAKPPVAAEVILETKRWGKLRLLMPLLNGTRHQSRSLGGKNGFD